MSGIQLNIQAPTFSHIRDQFSMERGGNDHNIRFQDARGIYTSDKASLASVKAFFGFGAQLEARATKRESGVDQIKQAIDRQYGAGMADRVLQDIGTHGRDLSGGIKRSDLELTGRTADGLAKADRERAQFDAARTDPSITEMGNNLNHPRLDSFVRNYFEVATHPRFWSTTSARSNAETIGSVLSMSVLNRIGQSGTIRQQDLDDLSKAMRPFQRDAGHTMDCPAAPRSADISSDRRTKRACRN